MDLRPLNESDEELLSSLAQQDDVWEFIGTLPLPDDEHVPHLFAVVEGQRSGLRTQFRFEGLGDWHLAFLKARRGNTFFSALRRPA